MQGRIKTVQKYRAKTTQKTITFSNEKDAELLNYFKTLEKSTFAEQTKEFWRDLAKENKLKNL